LITEFKVTELEREEAMKFKLALTAIIGCAALCLTLSASGQQAVTVHFDNVHDGSATWNGVAGGIYGGTVNGVNGGGIICDDFNDHISPGESWHGTAYSASSIAANITDMRFPGIGVTGYAEVASLVSILFKEPLRRCVML
jgi:hypothetical protein